MPGKRLQFDEETWAAVDLLAKDSMRDFQELADEAFRDLLAKHGRPIGLKAQLRGSLNAKAAAASSSASNQGRRPSTKRDSDHTRAAKSQDEAERQDPPRADEASGPTHDGNHQTRPTSRAPQRRLQQKRPRRQPPSSTRPR